jgi:hypothetical protein
MEDGLEGVWISVDKAKTGNSVVELVDSAT